MGKLTALFAARHKKPGMFSDGGGLYLQITSANARSWIFRYWSAEHQLSREMGLGSLHVVSLQEARDLAAECQRLRRQGVDPIVAKHTTKGQRRLADAKAMTFAQCVAAYIDAHRAGWKNPRHPEQWRNTLAQHAGPIIGDLPVQMIDTAAVHKVLTPIWTSTPKMAARVRARIEAVLDWAKVLGYRNGENPARWRGHLDKLLPQPGKVRRVEHHAAMPYGDIPEFMARLRARWSIDARALEFAILTAARSNEVLGAAWAEFDLGGATWTVPGKRMKGGKEHRVPLSSAALEIVKAVKSDNDLVFPSGTSGRALYKLLRRMGIENATTHGFRSAFRDWTAERTSFPREVCEAALAHATSEVEQAYRRTDLFEKRRELMNAWARYCDGAGSADVVPLRQTRQA
jgi:integrase